MSKSNEQMMNISIPSDMVDEVRRFMASLSMTDANSEVKDDRDREQKYPSNDSKCDSESEGDDVYVEDEVSRVCDHKILSDGKWQFKLQFKNDKCQYWIDDDDCNCEKLIAEYLARLGVYTAYLICRVSTKTQTGPGTVSLEAQEAALRKAVDNDKYRRIKVIYISASAYKGIPVQLQNIAEVIQSRSMMMFYRVDRLSRNIFKYLDWLEDLYKRDVVLRSIRENLDYSTNKLEFLRLLLLAQQESKLLGDKIRAANQYKRERGDEHIGCLPYGKRYYTKSDGSKGVENNPEEIKVYQRVQEYKGEDLDKLAAQLNREGIKKRGRTWNKTMVQRLRNKRIEITRRQKVARNNVVKKRRGKK